MENIYYLIKNRRILFEVAPRCGVHTVLNYTRQLTNNKNVERFRKFNIIKIIKNDDSYLKIKFVRNPYFRAVSSYVWVYMHYLGQPHGTGPLANISRNKLTFNKYLQLLKFYDLENCNHHFHYQWQGNKFNYTHKVEASDAELNSILSIFCNENIKLSKVIGNQRIKRQNPDVFVANIPQNKIEKTYGCLDYDSYIDSYNKDIIYNLYKIDFQNYSYSRFLNIN